MEVAGRYGRIDCMAHPLGWQGGTECSRSGGGLLAQLRGLVARFEALMI